MLAVHPDLVDHVEGRRPGVGELLQLPGPVAHRVAPREEVRAHLGGEAAGRVGVDAEDVDVERVDEAGDRPIPRRGQRSRLKRAQVEAGVFSLWRGRNRSYTRDR